MDGEIGGRGKKEIRVAIAGVGNCASSLLQGVHYYRKVTAGDAPVPGLMHNSFGGYLISDIKFVAAFDVDKRKVGKDLSVAIFEKPNCTKVFDNAVPEQGVQVQKGPVLDGIAEHMHDYPADRTFVIDSGQKPVDVAQELKKSRAEVLISYLPVGSEDAVRHYANAALEAGCAFINCVPVFIASDAEWAEKFREKGLPIIGDDIKSQLGATITHRVLTKLFADRGVKLERTYQLNTGGNTDFLNMKEHARLKSKKISKTSAVQSQMPKELSAENIHIGPSDYVPWQNDNKVCFIRMEGRKFGDVPLDLELRLSVEDSPNSGGVVIDAIRAAKLALERGTGGALTATSAYFMKHPPQQFPDTVARGMVEDFIKGERER
ncbi:MAG: inositol-3-phosphate synthase [Candidatus Diapherotrites archaeon]|nr:inositol-3-phosphate synthase [Candidatus Micrarchaeota archaeon]MBU1939578.1 inositol-3-phosphate synthase [Candidatus Micrarchaeota archaeon]